MSEQPPEFTESVEMSEADQADLRQLFSEADGEAEQLTFHPILRIWREVLSPAAEEMNVKPSPQWCTRIVQGYTEVKMGDMYVFRDRYYGKIQELAAILEDEIGTDPDCLTYTTPNEDVEHNSDHYKNLLREWQLSFLQWELDWDCAHADAAVDLAAISEIHKMFFGQTGLTAYLDNISFEFTEEDQRTLAMALENLRDGVTSE